MTPEPRSVLITGAASGIGKHYAETYGKANIPVAALDINQDALNTLSDKYTSITPFAVDMTDAHAVQEVVTQALELHNSFDRVINAAAIMPCGNILSQETSQIHKIMDINYGGLVNLTKAILPAMIKQGSGQFIVFSSMLGVMPTLKTGAYSASKFATSVFVEVLAQENKASGVQFACVCPPAVNTPLLDQVRETQWPKIMDETPIITIEDVTKAIEKGLKKGRFWIYPGKTTYIGSLMRRLFPEAVWKHIQKVEQKV
ncbi:MAG: SDR family NAD(P)-dependent oxidoreductase [Cellvibrionales bacterium]|nr:SDR family NAD(P)-dependent oxidoreductase [Cellvibrionales bacterium]